MNNDAQAPDYGFDGNPIAMVITLLILLAVDVVLFLFLHNSWRIVAFVLLAVTVLTAALVGWLFLYVMVGKLRHRDALLSLVDWRGNETVLDVGTGRGLLMIGAAKKLSGGRCIGIDIWRQQDMMNNTSEKTLANATIEGVTDRVEIKNEDIRSTNFPSDYFDVVFSNLCLHNISSKEGRRSACKEIARILKRNGTVVISDGFYLRQYLRTFREEGLSGRIVKAKFPPRFVWLHTVVARKD